MEWKREEHKTIKETELNQLFQSEDLKYPDPARIGHLNGKSRRSGIVLDLDVGICAAKDRNPTGIKIYAVITGIYC